MDIVDARVRLPQELRPELAAPADPLAHSEYDRILDLTNKTHLGTLESLLTELDGAGVAAAIVHAETEEATDADALNEAVAKVAASAPDRFVGVGTVDLPVRLPGGAARQVDRAASLGLVGINIEPAFFRIDIDDRRLYPAYARCEELGLVLNLHTGVNYSRSAPIRHERAELLDQVACDFPDLKIVACHGGWPQVVEFCAVARRHPTVYLELGGLAPKYLGRDNTGWDVLMAYIPKLLTRQVLFGTDWPVMNHQRVLREWRQLGLGEAVLECVLGGNARELFFGKRQMSAGAR